MNIAQMTWMQVQSYLEHDDRCIVPVGSTEQHAFLSLATDAILAERVATDAAEPLGIPVFPVLAYGITPYFSAFPGTVSLSAELYRELVAEILSGVARHGFRRILVVNGHGGNAPARPHAEAWAAASHDVELRWHDWWRGGRVRAAVDSIDPDGSHGSWMESFPWTRIAGVHVPAGHKAPVDTSGRESMTPEQFRELIGDGSFGGDYERSDDEMYSIWEIAVSETRALLWEDDGG
jgi:creatinine amidohydrolase